MIIGDLITSYNTMQPFLPYILLSVVIKTFVAYVAFSDYEKRLGKRAALIQVIAFLVLLIVLTRVEGLMS
jgi:hypothetical protein